MEGRQLESIQQELDVTQAKVRGGVEANRMPCLGCRINDVTTTRMGGGRWSAQNVQRFRLESLPPDCCRWQVHEMRRGAGGPNGGVDSQRQAAKHMLVGWGA